MIRAYCYASGLIEFGNKIPRGALIVAQGPAKELRDFIEVLARHGYRTRMVRGRRTKVPGSDTLLVPGVPEAENQHVALDALHAWMKWIAAHAPKGVRVLSDRGGSSAERAPDASHQEVASSNLAPRSINTSEDAR